MIKLYRESDKVGFWLNTDHIVDVYEYDGTVFITTTQDNQWAVTGDLESIIGRINGAMGVSTNVV